MDRRRPRRLMRGRLARAHAAAGRRRVSRRDGGGPLWCLLALLLLAPLAFGGEYELAPRNVVFRPGVSFDEARAAILAAGGSLDDLFATKFIPGQRIEVQLPPSAVQALAADARVLGVTPRRRFRIATHNAATAALSHVNELYALPYGLSGEGVVVSLFEVAEAQASHVEFGGRLHLAPTTSGGSLGGRRHATHVAGTIAASGLHAEAKGMAPAATIHQFCVPNPPDNACGSDWYTLKDEQLAPLGVVVDNNSWGWVLGWRDGEPPIWHGHDAYWGAYDLIYTAPLDQISNERGILFVHSVGNDGAEPVPLRFDPWRTHLHVDENDEAIAGQRFCVTRNGSGTDCPASCNAGCEAAPHHPATPFDTIGATASAKNVVSVGAIGSNLAVASLSSRGPAKDGRVKPEVVARGVNVLSTEPGNRYGITTGTSMAAAAVTGIAALLTEQWRRSHPGATPAPAQLKALLIAGTDDIGNPGPDYTFGFGLVNAKKAIDSVVENRVRTFTLAQGGVHEIKVRVEQPQDVRIVLNWADPAIPYLGGDDVAPKALVNDLDVKVVGPAGEVFLPWTLNEDDVSAHAVRGVNTVDPAEMIDIPDAAPGVYRVIVSGTNVPRGPQTAVLVTSAPVVIGKHLPKRRATR